MQWLFDFLLRSSDREATILAVTIWHVWEARNATRNEAIYHHSCVSVAKVRAYVEMILTHLYKLILPP
jgi:hypothetical protein